MHTPTTRRLIAAARLAADWANGADCGPLTSDGLVAELRAAIVEAERESPTSRLLAAARLALSWEDGDSAMWRLRGADLVAELRAAIAAVEAEATTAPHPAPEGEVPHERTTP